MTLEQGESPFSAVSKLNSEVYLPGIQRDIVWEEDDIKKLFDSIIEGYPIGSFIVWQRNTLNTSELLYDFTKNYAEDMPNSEAFETAVSNSTLPEGSVHWTNNETDDDDIENIVDMGMSCDLILDGQQRLTAMYVGILGSLSLRTSGDWTVGKKMYVNASNPSRDEVAGGMRHDFEFFDAKSRYRVDDEGNIWVMLNHAYEEFHADNNSRLNDIRSDVGSYIDDYEDENNVRPNFDGEYLVNTIPRPLSRGDVITREKLEDATNEDVLESFIRVNQEGEELSNSDFLLSVLTNSWAQTEDESDGSKQEINAKEQINGFIEHTARSSESRYELDVQKVLKCLAYCMPGVSSEYEISEFRKNSDDKNHGGIQQAKNLWEPKKDPEEGQIQDAVRYTMQLFESLDIPKTIFESNFTTVLPVVYWFHKNPPDEPVGDSNERDASNWETVPKKEIEFFIYGSLINDKYSNRMAKFDIGLKRAVDNHKYFPLLQINKELCDSISRRLYPTERTVMGALDKNSTFGGSMSFGLYRFIYFPVGEDIEDKDRDHIYPDTEFEDRVAEEFEQQGQDDYTIESFIQKTKNNVANSEMLYEQINENEKGDTIPKNWFTRYDAKDFRKHLIPSKFISSNNTPKSSHWEDVDESEQMEATWSNIEEFISERETLIIEYILDEYDIQYLKCIDNNDYDDGDTLETL